ncbi:MAG: hypothetical protein WC511_04855 [Candidatus Pacearchaeota archaeon]|jgi:hypothetical protein
MKKNKIWFRKRKGIFSKDLGYGWVPVSWEGNIMILLFILVNVVGDIYFGFPYKENSIINFMITLVASIIIFSIIAKYKTKK